MNERPALYAVFATLWMLTCPTQAFSIDLGSPATSGGEALEVKITEQPVEVAVPLASDTIEVVSGVKLDDQEAHRSEYLDVRDYRNVTFYVIPEKDMNELDQVYFYKLDAFFSVVPEKISIRSFGGDNQTYDSGSQEFGAMMTDEEGDKGKPGFVRLTTGQTASRTLTTPVLGPFVRVTLTSFTPDDDRKFRVIAYATR